MFHGTTQTHIHHAVLYESEATSGLRGPIERDPGAFSRRVRFVLMERESVYFFITHFSLTQNIQNFPDTNVYLMYSQPN